MRAGGEESRDDVSADEKRFTLQDQASAFLAGMNAASPDTHERDLESWVIDHEESIRILHDGLRGIVMACETDSEARQMAHEALVQYEERDPERWRERPRDEDFYFDKANRAWVYRWNDERWVLRDDDTHSHEPWFDLGLMPGDAPSMVGWVERRLREVPDGASVKLTLSWSPADSASPDTGETV